MWKCRLLFLVLFPTFSSLAQQARLDSLSTLAKTLTGARKAAVLNELAKNYFGQNPHEAFKIAQKALQIARQSGDQRQMGTALSYGGSAQYLLGDYKKALGWYLQALPLLEKVADPKGISSVTNNIGNVQYELGQLDQATRYYQRSLEMDERLGDANGVANSYHNLANVASDQNDPKQALDYNFRALRLYQRVGDLRNVGTTYNNIGNEYQTMNQPDKAKGFLVKALQISQQLGDEEGIGHTLSNLGKIYEAGKAYPEALQYLQKAEALAIKADFKKLLRETYSRLADVSAKSGDYAQAFAYQRKFQTLSDTLFKQENTRDIAELQTRYETEKREQQIQLLGKENTVKNLQLSQSRTILFSVAGGLLLALVLAGVLYSRNQIRQRANRELQRANALIQRSIAEKETLLKEIHHRVKNNLQLVTSLLNWQTEGVTDEKTLRIIDEGRSRVKSMALIHEHLYKSENLSEVNMQVYLGELADSLARSYCKHEGVVMEKHIQPFFFDADVVVPLGLITSELVSNAFKYAFAGTTGQVEIRLQPTEDGYQLAIADNGIGLPGDFGAIRKQSLGLQLVETLTKQLKGTLRIRQDGGTCFEVTFPGKKR